MGKEPHRSAAPGGGDWLECLRHPGPRCLPRFANCTCFPNAGGISIGARRVLRGAFLFLRHLSAGGTVPRAGPETGRPDEMSRAAGIARSLSAPLNALQRSIAL